MSHFADPSWCARLHAARSSAAQSAGAAPPADRATSDDPPPTDAPPAVERSAPLFIKREIPSVHECELCGTAMYDHNCKIVCPNCGYKRDCSDP
ncbi:MAG TPA: hypothetical protein VF665_12370 [Longimicrobium sp.]|jgi:rubrerythrin|uniref:hypothetical protein n=1 Tax=Longimicrobium sp. TaxID=2029185 RepID=UPI002EDA4C95